MVPSYFYILRVIRLRRWHTIRKHGSPLNVALRLVFALRSVMNRFLCALVLAWMKVPRLDHGHNWLFTWPWGERFSWPSGSRILQISSSCLSLFPTESNWVGLTLGFEHDALATLELVSRNMATLYYRTIISSKRFLGQIFAKILPSCLGSIKNFLISLSNQIRYHF